MNEYFKFNLSEKIEKKEEIELYNLIFKPKDDSEDVIKQIFTNNFSFRIKRSSEKIYKKIQEKGKILVIIDYIKKWERFTSIYFKNSNDKNNDKIWKLIKNFDSFALFEIWINNFTSYIDNLYWYCPIEYYQNWLYKYNLLNEKILLDWNIIHFIEQSNLSPYSYVNWEINKLFEKLNNLYKNFHISHKEKFWQWVFLWISMYKEGNKISMSQLKIEKPCLFYEIVYQIQVSLIKYNKYYYFSAYDYEDEWKESIWLT